MRTGHRTFWRVITMLAAVVVCLMLGAWANPGSRPHRRGGSNTQDEHLSVWD